MAGPSTLCDNCHAAVPLSDFVALADGVSVARCARCGEQVRLRRRERADRDGGGLAEPSTGDGHPDRR